VLLLDPLHEVDVSPAHDLEGPGLHLGGAHLPAGGVHEDAESPGVLQQVVPTPFTVDRHILGVVQQPLHGIVADPDRPAYLLVLGLPGYAGGPHRLDVGLPHVGLAPPAPLIPPPTIPVRPVPPVVGTVAVGIAAPHILLDQGAGQLLRDGFVLRVLLRHCLTRGNLPFRALFATLIHFSGLSTPSTPSGPLSALLHVSMTFSGLPASAWRPWAIIRPGGDKSGICTAALRALMPATQRWAPRRQYVSPCFRPHLMMPLRMGPHNIPCLASRLGSTVVGGLIPSCLTRCEQALVRGVRLRPPRIAGRRALGMLLRTVRI